MAPRKRKKHASNVPHLYRRRGKAKIWSGLIDGGEVSLGTADDVVAHVRLLELAAERRRAPQVPAPAEAPLLSAVAATYFVFIEPPRTSKKTSKTYANRVTAFVEWCEQRGIMRTDQVGFTTMSTFVKERSAKVKARTVNRDIVPIRSMFSFAKREGLISENPFRAEDFRDLKLKEPQPRPNATTLSPTQVKAVVATARELLPAGHAALIALVAGSGMRIDEARHIDEDDISSTAKGEVLMSITPKDGWNPKSYRHRSIPITKNTADAAREFIKTRASVRLDDKATWDAIRKVREHLSLPKFSMHDLRRAWASALHANGMSLKQISVLLGHSGIGVTERYIRIFEASTAGHEFLPL